MLLRIRRLLGSGFSSSDQTGGTLKRNQIRFALVVIGLHRRRNGQPAKRPEPRERDQIQGGKYFNCQPHTHTPEMGEPKQSRELCLMLFRFRVLGKRKSWGFVGAFVYKDLEGERAPFFPSENKVLLCGDRIEYARPAAAFASGVGLLVVGVTSDQRQRQGSLAENHLLEGGVHLAPGTGFLQRA